MCQTLDAVNNVLGHRPSFIEIRGMINSIEFQKAKWCALILHDRHPSKFSSPKIHEMFQIEWYNYLETARQHVGGRMWLMNRSVAVFINDEYIGSDIDFIDYINEMYVISIPIDTEFYENLIVDNLKQTIEGSRKFVYFTFTIDGILIGSFLFMVNSVVCKWIIVTTLLYTYLDNDDIQNSNEIQLHSDLLPRTCEYFFNLCVKSDLKSSEKKNLDYENSRVHRIVKNRWLQLGDIAIGDTSRESTPDESHCIPHDRIGVLSLSNNGTHRNGPQFIVCLNPNPWMDGNYIAFGQLIDGADTLKKIANIPTHYESPLQEIVISRCGEYCFGGEPKLAVNPDIFMEYGGPPHEKVSNGVETPLYVPHYTK